MLSSKTVTSFRFNSFFSPLSLSLLCRHIYFIFRSLPFLSLPSCVLLNETFAFCVRNYALSFILSSFFLLLFLVLLPLFVFKFLFIYSIP
jgi:hypothetical protein